MTQGQAGWIFLLIASICIFIIGMQGSLGVFIAIIFSPSAVTTSETGTPIAATSTWSASQSPILSGLSQVTGIISGSTTTTVGGG